MTTPTGSPEGQPPHGQPPYGQRSQGRPSYVPSPYGTPPGQPPYGPAQGRPPYGRPPYGPPPHGRSPYGAPHGQPPYGPPPQGYPAGGPRRPGPAPSASGPRRRWLLPVVAGAGVLVLLLAGGGVWLALGSRTPEVKPLWSIAAQADTGPLGGRTAGSWLLDTAIARGSSDGVIAYDQATGKRVWGVPTPEGTSLCGMSATVEDGIGAITYGPPGGRYCDHVLAIDTRTGRELWRADLVPRGARNSGAGFFALPSTARPSVSGGTVVVAESRQVHAYKASDGTVLWRLTDETVHPGGSGSCLPRDGLADDGQVLVILGCGDKTEALDIDLKTQRIRWTAPIPKSEATDVDHVVSASPAVLAGTAPKEKGGGSSRDEVLLSLDETGHVRATLSEADDLLFDHWSVPGRRYETYTTPIAGDTLITTTQEHKAKGESVGTRELVAIDLATGKRRWTTDTDDPLYLAPVSTDGTSVLALSGGDAEHPPTFLRFSLVDGSLEDEVATTQGTFGVATDGATVYRGGERFFIVSQSHGIEERDIIALG